MKSPLPLPTYRVQSLDMYSFRDLLGHFLSVCQDSTDLPVSSGYIDGGFTLTSFLYKREEGVR